MFTRGRPASIVPPLDVRLAKTLSVVEELPTPSSNNEATTPMSPNADGEMEYAFMPSRHSLGHMAVGDQDEHMDMSRRHSEFPMGLRPRQSTSEKERPVSQLTEIFHEPESAIEHENVREMEAHNSGSDFEEEDEVLEFEEPDMEYTGIDQEFQGDLWDWVCQLEYQSHD
jgi:hypothetical protein